MIEKELLIKIAIIVILGAILINFIVKPTIEGFVTYEKERELNEKINKYETKIKDLELSILTTNTSLSSCNGFNRNLLVEINDNSNEISACKSDLSSTKTDLSLSKKRYEELIENLQNEINNIETEKNNILKELETAYNELAKNTANNICCKEKVEHPSINYFNVVNNRITCTENNGQRISCYSTQI